MMKRLGQNVRGFHFQDFEAQPRAVGKATGQGANGCWQGALDMNN